MTPPTLPSRDLEPFAALALESVTREYPSHLSHLMLADFDALPPRELTPAFYGSFDWHSSVHGHWCLTRALRCGWAGEPAHRARAVLSGHLTTERMTGELNYLTGTGRAGFERPYGLAWLLQLAAELREWGEPGADWHQSVRPLERLAAAKLADWLPRLRHPIRSGEHSQTAFAMGLALDWARTAGDQEFTALLAGRAREFHARDHDAPIDYEPSGHDFLSPALGEADLMRRVLAPTEFADWLGHFLPDLGGERAQRWLTPVEATDRADGKLAHLDGLNLSRAWMLEGIASVLAAGDPRRSPVDRAAAAHRQAGLDATRNSNEYAGAHWLGSFATYLVTSRGLELGS